MFLVDSLVALVFALSVTLGNAQEYDCPQVLNNPNVTYAAKLLTKNSTNLGGIITGTAGPNGVGVTFDVHFWGFPEGLGPFSMSH
jgi:hypothetical protein